MGSTTLPKKRIALLGSTGSIGRQTLDVIRSNPDRFEVDILTALNNCDVLIGQAIEFSPNVVVIGNTSCYGKVASALKSLPIKVFAGEDSITQVMEMDSFDLMVSALVGYAGLRPTLKAIEYGKNVALANKETLVIAGDLVTEKARAAKVMILPVDSEHSAIFQCLVGEKPGSVEKIYLTASGGPFRGKTRENLKRVTREAALNHPNWKMGNKITIDSASLMNKGLEVIEARWLFGLKSSQIDVVIHPQSIIHSIVQFIDGSMKAQMGLPDMRMPILYALGFPERLSSELPRFNFTDHPQLTFEKPDKALFRNLALAYEALEAGGNMPCILNAANEIAVHAFLDDKIKFLEMTDVIERCLQTVPFISKPSYDDYVATHIESISKADEFILNKLQNRGKH
ncbi:MAG: 1-deoxy-D-xylulose-5-phosphate reductoisomerase [Bacteroidetes bacterium]|nr:1-deoxy-D-xylulose-5-phosphate reductoisomerase [Bacteroidota bacterium]